MFDFGNEPIRPEIGPAFERVWEELASPGVWWSSAEKIALAEVTRRTFEGKTTEQGSLPAVAYELARRMALDAHLITEDETNELCGLLGAFAYVELIGLVPRVMAIDTFCRLLGKEPEPFPTPTPGKPARQTPREYVGHHYGWVPGVTAMAINSLTRMNELAHSVYLTGQEMKNPRFHRHGLDRPQIELVAATVARLNDCFY